MHSSPLAEDVNIKLVPVLSPQNESDVRTNAVPGECSALYRGKVFHTGSCLCGLFCLSRALM